MYSSQRNKKCREVVVWDKKTCSLNGGGLVVYCVLNTVCPLAEVPLYMIIIIIILYVIVCVTSSRVEH